MVKRKDFLKKPFSIPRYKQQQGSPFGPGNPISPASPLSPGSPGRPRSPWAPLSAPNTSPGAPLAPAKPEGPIFPGKPSVPSSPGSPWDPCSPRGPGKPWKEIQQMSDSRSTGYPLPIPHLTKSTFKESSSKKRLFGKLQNVSVPNYKLWLARKCDENDKNNWNIFSIFL